MKETHLWEIEMFRLFGTGTMNEDIFPVKFSILTVTKD